MIELKCDNTATIVLATGEGSWRTKSAANKVYAVKEKVEVGLKFHMLELESSAQTH